MYRNARKELKAKCWRSLFHCGDEYEVGSSRKSWIALTLILGIPFTIFSTLFFVFLFLKLNNMIDWSYNKVFIPWYISFSGLIVFFIGNFHGIWWAREIVTLEDGKLYKWYSESAKYQDDRIICWEQCTKDGMKYLNPILPFINGYMVTSFTCVLLQLVLVAYKLDGNLITSWFKVLIPSFVMSVNLTLIFCTLFVMECRRMKLTIIVSLIAFFLIFLPSLLTVLVTALKLEKIITTLWSMILIPVWIFLLEVMFVTFLALFIFRMGFSTNRLNYKLYWVETFLKNSCSILLVIICLLFILSIVLIIVISDKQNLSQIIAFGSIFSFFAVLFVSLALVSVYSCVYLRIIKKHKINYFTLYRVGDYTHTALQQENRSHIFWDI